MTIYNINFGIGWASSGVEYAQAYRAKLLRRTNQDTKFVFLDFIQSENIQIGRASCRERVYVLV